MDATGPVSLTFNKPSPVLEVHLDFEFVPSAFAVQTLESGKWTDHFATDANVLPTMAPCGQRRCLWLAYGLRSFKVLSPSIRPVLEPCATVKSSEETNLSRLCLLILVVTSGCRWL